MMASLRNGKSSIFFILATLIAEVLFEQFLICNAVNGLNIADNEA